MVTVALLPLYPLHMGLVSEGMERVCVQFFFKTVETNIRILY